MRWGNGEPEEMHTREELVPAERPKVGATETSLPEPACKWAACSSKENGEMWLHIAQSVLYQTYLSQSSAHGDVHVAWAWSQEPSAAPSAAERSGREAVCLFAGRDLNPRSLLLLPFNMPLTSGGVSRPSGAVSAVLTVCPTKEAAVSESFWIRPKAVPKGTHAFTQGDKAMAVVPFWMAVASASSQDKAEAASNLQYATALIQIPTPPAVSKGVRLQKGRMTLKVMCLTNNEALAKGTRLMVAGKPPLELPVDNVMGVEDSA